MQPPLSRDKQQPHDDDTYDGWLSSDGVEKRIPVYCSGPDDLDSRPRQPTKPDLKSRTLKPLEHKWKALKGLEGLIRPLRAL